MPKHESQSAQLHRRLGWHEVDPAHARTLVGLAVAEDLAGLGLAVRPERPGDATGALLPESAAGRARLMARKACVLSGLPIIPLVLDAYGPGCVFTPAAKDGDALAPGAFIGEISGPVRTLLEAERILLNFVQKLSGIATDTARFAALLAGSRTRLLDTRKTTPGWRVLEKYAVACGGGTNHRIGLFDRVMLKDNHLAAGEATAGDRLAALVRRAREARPDLLIECEVDRLDQIPPVLEAGADIILLDNFNDADMRSALGLIGDRAWTEVSGGVTEATLPEIGRIGPDFVSTGALTHKSAWIDIGLDWA
jgi:nicotinate-nucleotide pyrophosphorylase (carboxylating)